MKRILLFLIACFFPFVLSHAQTFVPEGSYWRYCSTNHWFGVSSPSYFSITDVDTIDGKEIKTIGGTAENHFGVGSFHFYTSGDSTFVYQPADSSFHLIFNFSFQVGDTLRLTDRNSVWVPVNSFYDSTDYVKMVVDTIGTEQVLGSVYRYYHMSMDTSTLPGLFIEPFSVMEKIGLRAPHFILPVFYGGIWDSDYPELFYYTNDISPDFYGDSTGVCVLGMEEDGGWSGKIYPNPVADFLYIENPQPEKMLVFLTNTEGRIIRQGIRIQEQSTSSINLVDLPAGLYVLLIRSESGYEWRQQILKK